MRLRVGDVEVEPAPQRQSRSCLSALRVSSWRTATASDLGARRFCNEGSANTPGMAGRFRGRRAPTALTARGPRAQKKSARLGAAVQHLRLSCHHEQGLREDNRAENSHQVVRRRERRLRSQSSSARPRRDAHQPAGHRYRSRLGSPSKRAAFLYTQATARQTWSARSIRLPPTSCTQAK
jgi:hypothetical protein